MIHALTEGETALETAAGIVCRACGRAITRAEARATRKGAHVHARMNPHGYVHELGCYVEAPGCAAEGEATDVATWFPGYAWRIGTCRGCGEHLGWHYEGPAPFWGLILERLVGA